MNLCFVTVFLFCFHVVKPLMPRLALLPMLCVCEKPAYIHQVRIRLPTLALKRRGDVTRSPKQGYQCPQKWTSVLPKITNNTVRSSIELICRYKVFLRCEFLQRFTTINFPYLTISISHVSQLSTIQHVPSSE